MNFPKSLFESYENKTLGSLIDTGWLKEGDTLYNCMCGELMCCKYMGLTDDTPMRYAIIGHGRCGETFRAPLSDVRFNISRELCIADAIRRAKVQIKDAEYHLRKYQELMKKLNIHVID